MESKLTITEALAELKTLAARVEKKRASVLTYLARDARLRDPLENDGGSPEFVRRERQAINDMNERRVKIRAAIQKSNQETRTVLQGVDRTVADWLTWRREVAPEMKQFLATLSGRIATIRKEIAPKNMKITEDGSATGADQIIVHLSEKLLSEEIEMQETILGELDGRLSLLNATTTVTL